MSAARSLRTDTHIYFIHIDLPIILHQIWSWRLEVTRHLQLTVDSTVILRPGKIPCPVVVKENVNDRGRKPHAKGIPFWSLLVHLLF
jgi:hypothetical protein